MTSRFGFLDSTDGGQSNRQSVAADYQRSTGPSAMRATAFFLRNSLNLFSNFTYFLDDPENGDQFEQAERRIATGGRFTYRRLGHVFGRHMESAAGVQLRRDWLSPVGLYHTAARQRLSTTREDEVGQTMAGVHAQTEIEWTRAFRTTFGLRADAYQFDVTSDNPLNSGDGSDALVSPKFGAVFGPWSGTEFYANAGTGYHSNDARGAAIRVDPVSGAPADRVTPLVRAKGAELGLRTVRVRGLQSTVALWYLGIDSELLFVGDAGTTEPGRPSRRVGIEWSNYLRVGQWLTVDGDVAVTRARFTDADPSGDRIPGALDRVISAGITAQPRAPFFGSLRVRHFGPRPLDRRRQRDIQRAPRSGTAKPAIGSPARHASSWKSSTCSTPTCPTSTTSTRRGCAGNRPAASTTSTRIPRSRGPRASDSSFPSDADLARSARADRDPRLSFDNRPVDSRLSSCRKTTCQHQRRKFRTARSTS